MRPGAPGVDRHKLTGLLRRENITKIVRLPGRRTRQLAELLAAEELKRDLVGREIQAIDRRHTEELTIRID